MCFARFNLFALSYTFVLTNWPARKSPLFKLRIMELVGISAFWFWFSKVLLAIDTVPHRFLYLLVSFAVTSPLHVQVSSSSLLCRIPNSGLILRFLIWTRSFSPISLNQSRSFHLRTLPLPCPFPCLPPNCSNHTLTANFERQWISLVPRTSTSSMVASTSKHLITSSLVFPDSVSEK